MNNNIDYNNDRMYYPVQETDENNGNKKWDSCNIRQENAKYGFNVMPGGLISVGGRPQIVSGGSGKFMENKSSNPLNLINKK